MSNRVPEEQHAMFLPEIEEEDEENLKTPKTSILSLHKVGLPNQKLPPAQDQPSQTGVAGAGAGGPIKGPKGLNKSAAGIWR